MSFFIKGSINTLYSNFLHNYNLLTSASFLLPLFCVEITSLIKYSDITSFCSASGNGRIWHRRVLLETAGTNCCCTSQPSGQSFSSTDTSLHQKWWLNHHMLCSSYWRRPRAHWSPVGFITSSLQHLMDHDSFSRAAGSFLARWSMKWTGQSFA